MVGIVASAFRGSENAASHTSLCLPFLPPATTRGLGKMVSAIDRIAKACAPGQRKASLFWALFVLVRGCHLGGFILLGNRLRKMGDSGFYGYWASWDLHNVFQRTDSVGTMWTQEEHKGTQKRGARPGKSSSFSVLD